MLSRKLWLSVAVAGVLACLPARASAQATISHQPVYFTFANPVAIPGMTLQPGQYEFRMTTDKGDRNIVKVYEKDTGKAVATVMAIPAHLTNAQPVPEKPEVRFYETAANQPAPIQSWWYPGIHDGHAFVYSQQEAQQIAKLNPQGVPTTEGAAESGRITRATSNGQAANANSANAANREPASVNARNNASAQPEMNPTPRPQPRTQARAQAQDNGSMNSQPAPTRRTLPKTASELPFFAGVGVVSLLAGVTLMRRRRVA